MASETEFIPNLMDFLINDEDISEIFGENVFWGKPLEEANGPSIQIKEAPKFVQDRFAEYIVDLYCFHESKKTLILACLLIRDKLANFTTSDSPYWNFYPIALSENIKEGATEKNLRIFSFGIKVNNV